VVPSARMIGSWRSLMAQAPWLLLGVVATLSASGLVF